MSDPLAQVAVHLAPQLDRTLLDHMLDALAQVSHDIAHQVIAVGLREHLTIEVARLDEVVVFLMRDIRFCE